MDRAPPAGEMLASVDSTPTEGPYDDEGVDRSLIRWMLRLSPAERLAHVQGVIDMIHATRRTEDGDR